MLVKRRSPINKYLARDISCVLPRILMYHMMTSSIGNIFRVTGPLCGEFTVPVEFPAQRPVTRSFDVFFDLRLNKQFSKQSRGWWFETLSCPFWRHCNENPRYPEYILRIGKPLHFRQTIVYCVLYMIFFYTRAITKTYKVYVKKRWPY